MATIRRKLGGRWTAAAIWWMGFLCFVLLGSRVTLIHWPLVLLSLGLWFMFESREYAEGGRCSECGADTDRRTSGYCPVCREAFN